MKKNMKYSTLGLFLSALFPVVLLMCVLGVLGTVDAGTVQQGRENLEQALRRAAVTCYARQGAYPADLEELADYSGVQIDESRYQVFYDVFADNLMPDITVLVKES